MQSDVDERGQPTTALFKVNELCITLNNMFTGAESAYRGKPRLHRGKNAPSPFGGLHIIAGLLTGLGLVNRLFRLPTMCLF